MPNTGSGAGHDTLRHTSHSKPSILPPELFSLRSKACALSGFGAAAWLPGSECALSPSAQVILLNGRAPGQLPLLFFTLSAWSSEQPSAVSAASALHVALLNSLLPFQLPLLHSRSHLPNRLLPRQVASLWWAKVVKRWLCCCAHRVVQRCATHPPRVGGLSSPQHFLCEEILGAPSAPYMHVGGPHDFARSANSWGTLAAAGWGLQGGWKARGRVKG